MTKKPMKVNYDQSGDVLYIVFGNNTESYADEIDDGVYVRYDIETDELVGITIISFSERAQTDLLNLISLQDVSRDALKESFAFAH